MNPLAYAAKVVVCSAILFGYYYLFLRNRRFHGYNRTYVLVAAVFSVLFPLFRIPVFTGSDPSAIGWLKPLQAISPTGWEAAFVVTAQSGRLASFLNWQTAGWILYATGFLVSNVAVISSLLYIRKLTRRYRRETLFGIAFYNTREPGTPFSFLHTVFWNNQIPLESERGWCMLQHELFHIRARHSYDILFMQLLTNLFWFNPVFHLFLRELKTIHEFVADDRAATDVDKWEYAELLVEQAIVQKKILVSHQFFHHQIKRRIAMIIQPPPSRTSRLSRIMTLPLLIVLFAAFTFQACRQNTTDGLSGTEINPAKARQKQDEGLVTAAEFKSQMEKHQNEKGIKSMDVNSVNDLLTVRFKDGDSVRTKLSEFKKLSENSAPGKDGTGKPIFTKVEIESEFPGGQQAYMRFLNRTFHYPEEAQRQEIQGTVIVLMQVGEDGTVSNVQAISGPEKGGLKEEAVRVIKASGKWEPARQNGHPVASYKKQPIIFKLDTE